MEAVNSALVCYCPNEPTTRQSLKASQAQVAAITSNRSMDMQLVTEEGDKVTFSLDAKASAFYASYAQVEMDDDSFQSQWEAYGGGEIERQMSLTVEGDLNKQERRDIKKVMKTLHRMMNNFVNGRLNPMAAKAQKLQGLETIDRLDVEMSYERQVLVARQTQSAVSYGRSGEMSPMAKASTHQVESPVNSEAKVLAREMSEEVRHSQAPVDPLKAFADRLFAAFREQASQWHETNARIVDDIRDMFNAALEGHRSWLDN